MARPLPFLLGVTGEIKSASGSFCMDEIITWFDDYTLLPHARQKAPNPEPRADISSRHDRRRACDHGKARRLLDGQGGARNRDRVRTGDGSARRVRRGYTRCKMKPRCATSSRMTPPTDSCAPNFIQRPVQSLERVLPLYRRVADQRKNASVETGRHCPRSEAERGDPSPPDDPSHQRTP